MRSLRLPHFCSSGVIQPVKMFSRNAQTQQALDTKSCADPSAAYKPVIDWFVRYAYDVRAFSTAARASNRGMHRHEFCAHDFLQPSRARLPETFDRVVLVDDIPPPDRFCS
jgi:hypothetical protein